MLRKFFHITAIVLLLFNGMGAVYGGGNLVMDASGRHLQLPARWLEHTPFRNFFIPGLLLFLLNGIGSFVALSALLFRAPRYPLYVLSAGLLLTAWIVAELLLTRLYHPLQLVMAVTAGLLLLCGMELNREDRGKR